MKSLQKNMTYKYITVLWQDTLSKYRTRSIYKTVLILLQLILPSFHYNFDFNFCTYGHTLQWNDEYSAYYLVRKSRLITRMNEACSSQIFLTHLVLLWRQFLNNSNSPFKSFRHGSRVSSLIQVIKHINEENVRCLDSSKSD